MLDAGCGNGRLLRYLSKVGKEVVGLELNEFLVRKAAESGEVVCGSVMDIPFRDMSFDESVSNGVMWYVEDLERAVSELVRVSKKRATWSYIKFRASSTLNPRSLQYVVRGWLGGWLFPRPRRELLKHGRILLEDDRSFVLVTERGGPSGPEEAR